MKENKTDSITFCLNIYKKTLYKVSIRITKREILLFKKKKNYRLFNFSLPTGKFACLMISLCHLFVDFGVFYSMSSNEFDLMKKVTTEKINVH